MLAPYSAGSAKGIVLAPHSTKPNNMKKLTLCMAAFALAGSMMAQDNRFSAGLEIGLPMGDFGEVSSLGIGGTLGFEAPVADQIGLIAQAGYISFMGKEYETVTVVNGVVTTESVKADASGIIPVQVGGKYYFSDNQEGAYLGALFGVHMQSVEEVTGINVTTGTFETEKSLKSNFSFAPLLGYIVGENIDLGVRYQIISAEGGSSSYLGLRAAYMF